jgi:alpha-glucosidase
MANPKRLWWQDGVVYQIYPRSFFDANGDGVGDLEGIRRRLDHLAWLGIDAVWLSPIYPSPMADFGYDVADYCDIDPLFGSLEDFDRLLAEARERGIRLILDWVPNHSSDQHPWFQESLSGRTHPKRDWYVWRDPGPEGEPPNNWQSVFGGGAWEWDETSGQFYLHSFLKEQPDLNWRNPELVLAMHDTLRFWLDRGVGGFRIDVIHKLAKDPELRDNPSNGSGHPGYLGQEHVHDENHPDVIEMLKGLRRVLDEYDERMTVGEVFIMDPKEAARYYVNGEGLHLAFNFSFLQAPWEAKRFREEVEAFERELPAHCWPDLVLSNHDVRRHASRYDDPQSGDARARVAAAMLLSLRGTPFLYYGEEIGMRNVPIPEDRILDPVGIHIHPAVGRDGERTPMQWEPRPGAGFTRGEPWLPIAPDADRRNVALQRDDPTSLLHLYRDLLALRRSTPALHRGDYRSLDGPDDVFAYERRAGDSRALVALNFSDDERRPQLPDADVHGGLRTQADAELPRHTRDLHLAPNEAAVLVVEA